MRTNRASIIFPFLLLAALVVQNASGQVVTFNDAVLELHVRDLISKPTGDVLESDVDDIQVLALEGLGISDISGLEAFLSMYDLQLADNNVSDLSPLIGLTAMLNLDIRGNPVTDYSAIAAIPNLANLLVGTAGITPDFPSLSGTPLQQLTIDNVTSPDLTTIPTNLPLTNLYLEGLGLTSISHVANFTGLTWLVIGNNDISDISAVASLTALQFLHADDNNIVDLTPLIGLSDLFQVRLERNPLGDLAPLATLPSLGILNLGECGISNISALAGASQTLTFLHLFDNEVADLSPVAGLAGLETLSVGSNLVTSVNGLENLPNLQTVNLIGNLISDVTPLELNSDIDTGTTVSLQNNPLSLSARCSQVPAIRARGANVLISIECDEDPFPCPLWPIIDAQGEAAFPAVSLDWHTDDGNGDGIPDRWQARLVAHTVCNANRPFHEETVNALTLNMSLLLSEPSPSPFDISALSQVRHMLAALILVSEAGKSNVSANLGLIRDYAVVEDVAKTATEPYSGEGDLDADGATNLEEYLNVIANGGDIEDFAFAATSSFTDGSKILPVTNVRGLLLMVTLLLAAGGVVLRRHACGGGRHRRKSL